MKPFMIFGILMVSTITIYSTTSIVSSFEPKIVHDGSIHYGNGITLFPNNGTIVASSLICTGSSCSGGGGGGRGIGPAGPQGPPGTQGPQGPVGFFFKTLF